MDRAQLLQLIDDDDLELLKIKPKGSSASSSTDRLVASFGEINDFVRTKQRAPGPNRSDVQEYRLFSRLEALREDGTKLVQLTEFDEFGLLGTPRSVTSLGDIYADDELGLLVDAADDIFQLRNVPKETTMPDYVAQRRPCPDFSFYEPLFSACQADLAAARRRLWRFSKEQQIEKGLFFVLRGVLLYVADAGAREMINGKSNARLKCVFENGTESDMLLRSLSAELYKDGRRVSLRDDELLDGLEAVSDEDRETGYVYVVKSLSPRDDIRSMANLHKVGFSRFPPEDRIKGAEADPTFLMAPAGLVAAFKLFNLNPNHLENLLHRFFAQACVEVEVTDGGGVLRRPREWFIAPVDVIEQAVQLLRSGEIVDYRYDPQRQEIVAR